MSPFVSVTVALLAWGAFTGGAVYPWAYLPLLATCGALAAWGWSTGVNDPGPVRVGSGVLPPLVGFVCAVLLQLLPLSHDTVTYLSPARLQFAAADSRVYFPETTSATLSIRPQATWLGLVFVLAFIALWLGFARRLCRSGADQFVRGLLGVGVGLALVGIIQRFLDAREIYGFWMPAAGDLFGPFVNRNHFAGWMLMALPTVTGYFCGLMAASTRRRRFASLTDFLTGLSRADRHLMVVGLAILLMSVSLAMTMSRSGIACFTVALSMMSVLVLRTPFPKSSRAAAIVFFWAVIVGSVGAAGYDTVAARFALLKRSHVAGRLHIWQDAVRAARQFPWVGSGFNTYRFVSVSETGRTQDVQDRLDLEAHNDYLQLAAEGGVLLGMPALITIVQFVREVWRRFNETDDPMTYWIRAGASTGLVAVALQELVDFSLHIPGNVVLFTALCALAIRKLPSMTTDYRPQ
jgi:O-antigen ligase